MISNILFGQAKVSGKWSMYVYDNLSINAMIGICNADWLEAEYGLAIVDTISHETIHKVLFKLEGAKTSHALDKWCKSRDWIYNDHTGVCFFSWDIEPENPIYQKAKTFRNKESVENGR